MTPAQAVNRPRTLGTTGLPVSRIGLGLAALGRPGYINLGRDEDLGGDRGVAAMEARAHGVLDEAWRQGVRYLDAARSYGRAETFLGAWLASRDVAPDAIVVARCSGPTSTSTRSIRSRLRAPRSTIAACSRRLFDAVQATWNLFERSAAAALAEARAAAMGVIVKEALANGRLTPHDTDADSADGRAALQAEARRLGTTLDALALAAALAQPWADFVLSGAATHSQLRSNLRALEVAWDAEADAALDGLTEDGDAYWRRRQRLAWS